MAQLLAVWWKKNDFIFHAYTLYSFILQIQIQTLWEHIDTNTNTKRSILLMRTISGLTDGLFKQRYNTQALNGFNYLKLFFLLLSYVEFIHIQNIKRGHYGPRGKAEQAISQPLFVFGRQLCARLFIKNDPYFQINSFPKPISLSSSNVFSAS